MMPDHFCVVDDDQDFLGFLGEYTNARGLKTSRFASAEALLHHGQIENFDFFILDLGLPGTDGVDLISMIRAKSSAGILVVSGRMGPDAFNSALNAGADMFINKPVRFDQIYNAVQTIYRRSKSTETHGSTWVLDRDTRTLIAPQQTSTVLSETEHTILQKLLAASPNPVSREELAEASGVIPGTDFRNLDAAIFRLRRKIERETQGPAPLRTERGRGYSLAASIQLR